jgi:two-component system sensor histidine kinase QseC
MRRRLLVVLLGLVAAIWTAAALFSYFDARHELDEMFDAHLAQSASLLIAQAGHDLDEIDEHAADLHRYARRVAFQFWEDGRVLRLHSANAPSTRMSSQDEGFADVRIDGAGWRVFSGRDPSRRYVVQVGERTSARDAIVGTMIRNMLWPLLFALPLLAIVVWIAIARVMRPLGLLNRQVVARAPDNLAPLALNAAPAEVAPLAANLNRLFERVRTSIENERRFTADAAHELRTPLAAIRAQAQVARGATADAERTHALESVIAGCDRAVHVVDQLLTLARLEPEGFAVRRARCDLQMVARECIADIATSANARTITVTQADGPPVVIDADERLLRTLLRNLLDNAVRYSPDRSEVRVRVTESDDGASIVVADRGPGVPAAERDRLGQRFHRLQPGATTGTGLGLSIVKRIAALHDATVAFDAVAEGGLAVTVSFRRVPPMAQ